MNTYAFLIKAKAKSEKKSLFCWLSAKSDSRAEREIMNILEDEEIPAGRGGDYNLPLRTDWFVVDDLPEEGVLDDTWCDRYELNDDGQSWRQIPKSEPASTSIQDEHATVTSQTTSTQLADGTITIDQASFIQRISGGWLYESFTELSVTQQREISALQHDMDATYVQNLLLALNNAKELLQAQHRFPETLFGLIDSIKSVWVPDGKAPSVGDIVSFSKEWLNARNEDSTLERSGPYRHEVTAKWSKKSGVQRTESGAIAGGNNKTDRNPDYTHTLDTLDIEIALATLPMDFDIYEIPVSLHRRAKEIIANKEEPFKTWSKHLRNAPAVLNYSRAAIFALIRSCYFGEDVAEKPESLLPYINANLVESDHANPSQHQLIQARHLPAISEKGNVSSPEPEIKSVGKGMFSIGGLANENQPPQQTQSLSIVDMVRQQSATKTLNEVNQPSSEAPSNEGEKPENDGVDNVQMETAGNQSSEADSALSTPANDNGSIEEAQAALESAVNKWIDEGAAAAEPVEPTVTDEPPYFEPGRYEGVPNNDYHAANGISSTQVKDARISLMYYHGRHISKTIRRDSSDALTFGSLVHTLALEPEKLEEEYAVFPVLPQGAFTNTESMVKFIREYNATLTPLLSSDEIKPMLEEYNATLPAPVALGGSVDDIGNAYMRLPEDFKTIPADAKFTATVMKACIKEYNATLPTPLKTTGSRDALLEQLSIIKPELVTEEMAKPLPLNVSGSKETLTESIRTIKPDAIFADEFEQQWLDGLKGKTVLTGEQLQIATAIQQALFNHPTAGKLLQHAARAVEVSYFGMDEGTGLEVRVRPDLELELDGLRIAADVKTISLGKVKQDNLRAKMHREIIDRDYHVSAAMYSEVADFDQFFWIFVNKDEGYHWVAVIEASTDLLELGSLEYHRTMRDLANAYDTDTWPAPVTTDYTDELNDFDLRRLEALRVA